MGLTRGGAGPWEQTPAGPSGLTGWPSLACLPFCKLNAPKAEAPWWPLCPVPAPHPRKGWAETQGPATSSPGSAVHPWPPLQCQLTAQGAGAEIPAPLGSPCPLPTQWSQPQISALLRTPVSWAFTGGQEKPCPVPALPQALGTWKQSGWGAYQAWSLRGFPPARLSRLTGPQGPELGTCPALLGAHGGPGLLRPQRRDGERGGAQ